MLRRAIFRPMVPCADEREIVGGRCRGCACESLGPASAKLGRFLALAVSLCATALLACRPHSDDVVLVGTVERTLIDLVAPVSERITAIQVARGTRVRAGDVVAQLDPSFALSDLASAEAELAGARTGSSIAATDLQRAEELYHKSVISSQALDRARLARDEAATRHWAAEARVAAMRKRVADHAILAPVDGVVDQLPFDVGERVPIGAVVAVILQDGAPWVRVWLPERAYPLVGPGSAARIRIEAIAGELHGHVLDVAREPEFTPHYALTERERVYLVYETRIAIDDAPGSLRPGAPADVLLALPAATAPEAR